MTTIDTRLEALIYAGNKLSIGGTEQEAIMARARVLNPWFTQEYVQKALDEIANWLKDVDLLRAWVQPYVQSFENGEGRHVIGIIAAGNIPAVGFHDMLCGYVSGHRLKVKLSDKDDVLIPYILSLMAESDVRIGSQVELVPKLSGFDAVIATGSNSSNMYFEQYFGKYPHIIRGHRNSVAVIHENDTDEDLKKLGSDVFTYYGLGCRNVTKMFLPQGYDVTALIRNWTDHERVIDHNKYKNNYDYHKSIYLINGVPHYDSGFLLLLQNEAYHARIATVHYEFYSDQNDLESALVENADKIQAIASNQPIGKHATVGFGESQSPALDDYADGVNVMEFLSNLKH